MYLSLSLSLPIYIYIYIGALFWSRVVQTLCPRLAEEKRAPCPQR